MIGSYVNVPVIMFTMRFTELFLDLNAAKTLRHDANELRQRDALRSSGCAMLAVATLRTAAFLLLL